jgi:hypothetical protein
MRVCVVRGSVPLVETSRGRVCVQHCNVWAHKTLHCVGTQNMVRDRNDRACVARKDSAVTSLLATPSSDLATIQPGSVVAVANCKSWSGVHGQASNSAAASPSGSSLEFAVGPPPPPLPAEHNPASAGGWVAGVAPVQLNTAPIGMWSDGFSGPGNPDRIIARALTSETNKLRSMVHLIVSWVCQI